MGPDYVIGYIFGKAPMILRDEETPAEWHRAKKFDTRESASLHVSSLRLQGEALEGAVVLEWPDEAKRWRRDELISRGFVNFVARDE